MKDRGHSERTTNRLLNDFVGKNWIFRLEMEGHVYYRINNFPKEVQLFLAFINSFPDDNDFKNLLDQIKVDIIKLHGKLTFEQILNMWYGYIKGLSEGDKQSREFLSEFFQKLKDSLV